jgi:hypothetical protein
MGLNLGNQVRVKCNYIFDSTLNYLKVSIFPDRLYMIPVSVEDNLLWRVIASVCAFSTAVNYHIEKAMVFIDTDFLVPYQFIRIVTNEHNILFLASFFLKKIIIFLNYIN